MDLNTTDLDAIGHPEDPATSIANALWFDCGNYIECKTNDLEEAADLIIQRLEREGYRIIFDPTLPKSDS